MRKDFCDLCEREIVPRDKVKVKIELSNHPDWCGPRRFTLGRPPYWAEIPNELGTLQDLVGGCIECVGLGHSLVAIVDGEEFCSIPDGVLNLG